MRYLLLFIIAYFVFRYASRLLNRLQEPKDKTQVEGETRGEKRFGVDQADVEDAEFKDVE